MSQSRDGSGQFTDQTTVDGVLEALKTANEPVTATEIAERLDISTRTALRKLTELSERDPTVIRKQVGGSAVIWFIKHGAIHEQAFAAFADRLTDECGEVIERIILYGSVARGEAHESSDVDVLIVIKEEEDREAVRERASELSFETMMEYDVLISEMITTKDEYENGDRSFLRTVQTEGMAYAG